MTETETIVRVHFWHGAGTPLCVAAGLAQAAAMEVDNGFAGFGVGFTLLERLDGAIRCVKTFGETGLVRGLHAEHAATADSWSQRLAAPFRKFAESVDQLGTSDWECRYPDQTLHSAFVLRGMIRDVVAEACPSGHRVGCTTSYYSAPRSRLERRLCRKAYGVARRFLRRTRVSALGTGAMRWMAVIDAELLASAPGAVRALRCEATRRLGAFAVVLRNDAVVRAVDRGEDLSQVLSRRWAIPEAFLLELDRNAGHFHAWIGCRQPIAVAALLGDRPERLPRTDEQWRVLVWILRPLLRLDGVADVFSPRIPEGRRARTLPLVRWFSGFVANGSWPRIAAALAAAAGTSSPKEAMMQLEVFLRLFDIVTGTGHPISRRRRRPALDVSTQARIRRSTVDRVLALSARWRELARGEREWQDQQDFRRLYWSCAHRPWTALRHRTSRSSRCGGCWRRPAPSAASRAHRFWSSRWIVLMGSTSRSDSGSRTKPLPSWNA